MVHIYHGIVLRNGKELFIPTTTWVNLKDIILGEKSQSHKVTYISITFKSDKSIEVENKLVVASG